MIGTPRSYRDRDRDDDGEAPHHKTCRCGCGQLADECSGPHPDPLGSMTIRCAVHGIARCTICTA